MARPNLKEQIITKGAEFVFSNGFTASGVSEITQAAGVPKGSFYNHFDSKEAFGLEILQRYFDESMAKTVAFLDDTRRPPIERLRAYIDAMAEGLAACQWEHGCLMGNFVLEASCSAESIRERLKTMFGAWSGKIAACIAEAQQSGAIRNTTDAAILADFMVNAWEGAVLRMKVERTRAALDTCTAVLFDIVLV